MPPPLDTSSPSRDRVSRCRWRCFWLGGLFWIGLALLWPWLMNMEQWRTEIDLNTGRLRSTDFYWGLKTSEELEETYVSKALGRPHATKAQWQTVMAGNHEVMGGCWSFTFHDFYNGMYQLEQLDQPGSGVVVTPAAQREIAEQALQLLRQDELRAACEYMRLQADHLLDMTLMVTGEPVRVEVADLKTVEEIKTARGF